MGPQLIGHGRYLIIGTIKSPQLGNATSVPGVSLSQFQSLRSERHFSGPQDRDIFVRVMDGLDLF